MSTHWDIHCRTCDEGAGFSINHGEKQLHELLIHQETWAEFAECVEASDIELRLLGDEGGALCSWPAFAKKHLKHNVTLRNEYGVFNGECGRSVRCQHCSAHHSCNLPRQHSGACRRL